MFISEAKTILNLITIFNIQLILSLLTKKVLSSNIHRESFPTKCPSALFKLRLYIFQTLSIIIPFFYKFYPNIQKMGNDCSNLRYIISKHHHHARNTSKVTKILESDKLNIRVWCCPPGTKLINFQEMQNCQYFQQQLTSSSATAFLDVNRGFINPSYQQLENYYANSQIQPKNIQKLQFNRIMNQNGVTIKVSQPKHFEICRRIDKNGETIKEGDEIFMGDWGFKIKMILSGNQILAMKNKFEEFKTKKLIEEDVDEDLYCKFCYEKSGPHNPLIKPCQCQGTIQGIHRQCISEWVLGDHLYNYRENIFQDGEKTFRLHVRRARCQICHTAYEKFITYQILNKIFPIKPEQETYLILETSRKKNLQEQDMPREFVCHVFSKNSKSMKIGRSPSCNYCPQTNSVSKLHVSFLMLNNQIFIKDQGSKFGTFKKCENLGLDEGYQMGNIYFQLQKVHQTIKQEYSQNFFPHFKQKTHKRQRQYL